MSKRLRSCAILIATAICVASPLVAQGRSAVSPSELDAAAAARSTGNRETIVNLLATPQAQKIATRMGVSTRALSTRVAALDQATVNQIAAQAGVNDKVLAGGSETVVISTTVIIIFLLVLILITR